MNRTIPVTSGFSHSTTEFAAENVDCTNSFETVRLNRRSFPAEQMIMTSLQGAIQFSQKHNEK